MSSRHALNVIFTIGLAAACSAPPAAPTDTREPIDRQYVGGMEMPVHQRPDDKSRVITRFRHGESVPILTKKGDWVEVQTALGSGWAHQSDLVTAAEAESQQSSTTVKFLHPPAPVSAPGAHGTVYIEADVNTDGDVLSTTIVENSTGRPELADENAVALRKAKFYPLVIRGERKPFKYDYRVDY